MGYKAKYFVDGMTLKQLAEKINLKYGRVFEMYKEYGYRHLDDFIEHIRKRKYIYIEGLSINEVAKIVNRTVPVVRYWYFRYGFDRLQQFIDKDKTAKRGRFIDMTGKRYGSLTVIKKAEFQPEYQTSYEWLVRCDCGREFSTDGVRIRRGGITSCGCKGRYGHPSIEGLSFSGIAAIVGVGPETVATWYRRLGYRKLEDFKRRAEMIKEMRMTR